MNLLLNIVSGLLGLLALLGAFASGALLLAAVILPVFSLPVTEQTVSAQLWLLAFSIAAFVVTCISGFIAQLVADQ